LTPRTPVTVPLLPFSMLSTGLNQVPGTDAMPLSSPVILLFMLKVPLALLGALVPVLS